jgi:hypothetical protein
MTGLYFSLNGRQAAFNPTLHPDALRMYPPSICNGQVRV